MGFDHAPSEPSDKRGRPKSFRNGKDGPTQGATMTKYERYRTEGNLPEDRNLNLVYEQKPESRSQMCG